MKQGKLLSKLGIVLIIMAFSLFLFSLGKGYYDKTGAKKVVSELYRAIPQPSSDASSSSSEIPAIETPEYLLTPDYPMPIIEVDGKEYCGIISIPALDVESPVLNWSEDKGLLSRFSGSLYRSNMVVVSSDPFNSLRYGDAVAFRDLGGHIFVYSVIEIETVPLKDLVSGSYPLNIIIHSDSASCTIVRVG